MRSQSQSPKQFYDLDQIKSIPIVDVCNAFGIPMEPKGGKIWCKLRPERTASAILHPDRNIVHDFGTSETSDVIGLVSIFHEVDRGRAIRMLADKFTISPVNPRGGLSESELTIWEYSKIGLDGKMSTNNFDFDKSLSEARVLEISLRYAMPMNVLKKNNPLIYEKLLRKRALPFVGALRKDYYIEVFSKYNLARQINAETLFKKMVDAGDFADQIKELQNAERILTRACQGTKINVWEVGAYDPEVDLQKILSGEIKISTLGNATYDELKKLAEEQKTSPAYYTVDFDGYMNLNGKLDAFRHNAYLKDGNIVVQYLQKDWRSIKDILGSIRIQRKENLNDQIKTAQQRNDDKQATGEISEKENPTKSNKGKER